MNSVSNKSRTSLNTLYGTSLMLALVFGLAATLPTSAQNKNINMTATRGRVMLMAEPQSSGLQNATGYADVDVEKGTVTFTVMLAEGSQLPAGTVLEGWLSSAGRKGGPGMSTASESDQKFGPAFGKEELSMIARDVPYALSTGLLRRKGNTRTYTGSFKIDNPLTPYAAVAVTLESDGNTGNYDPRPGSPFMSGMIKDATTRASR